MAYYLTVQKRQGEYTEINVKKMKEFERLTRFTGNSYSLEEIDVFTSKFDSETQLKSKLYDKGIIDLEDITKEISIRIKKNDKLEKVRYDLVYENTKKFLDKDYLVYSLLSLQNDRVFLEKLVSNYRNSYSNAIAIAEIKNYLLGNFNINIYSTLSHFFIKEIFNVDGNGVATLKYKSLHDLAMFVCNYITKKEQRELGISEEDAKSNKKKKLLELQNSKISSNQVKPKTKKLTKKEVAKQPIEGQISIFDEML